jgi:BON domain
MATAPNQYRSAFEFIALMHIVFACACSQAISPRVVEDALTAARVKTALVNDATVGVRPIEVMVTNGVVRLSGVVTSEAEAQRAVELARSILGVTKVESDLRVEGAGQVGAPASSENPPSQEAGVTRAAVEKIIGRRRSARSRSAGG